MSIAPIISQAHVISRVEVPLIEPANMRLQPPAHSLDLLKKGLLADAQLGRDLRTRKVLQQVHPADEKKHIPIVPHRNKTLITGLRAEFGQGKFESLNDSVPIDPLVNPPEFAANLGIAAAPAKVSQLVAQRIKRGLVEIGDGHGLSPGLKPLPGDAEEPCRNSPAWEFFTDNSRNVNVPHGTIKAILTVGNGL